MVKKGSLECECTRWTCWKYRGKPRHRSSEHERTRRCPDFHRHSLVCTSGWVTNSDQVPLTTMIAAHVVKSIRIMEYWNCHVSWTHNTLLAMPRGYSEHAAMIVLLTSGKKLCEIPVNFLYPTAHPFRPQAVMFYMIQIVFSSISVSLTETLEVLGRWKCGRRNWRGT